MRLITLIAFLLCACATGWSQNQIPGGDFEDWSSDGLNLFEEPTGGWWATLNPLRNLGGPVSVDKVSGAHSGNYAARLVTETYGTILVPGILLSGSFNLLAAPNYFTRGQPYTSRPSTFEGWYQYTPTNGDSGAIAVQLTRWNTLTSQRDTVGEVGIIIHNATSSWTQFVLPIVYYSNDLPDTLVVVATSSADGGNLNGSPGSEMRIDDFDMALATARDEAQRPLAVGFGQQADQWTVDLERETGTLAVYDLSGQVRWQQDVHPGRSRISTEGWNAGIYLVEITGRSGRQWRQKVALIR